jgi:hypothetical protein
MAYNKTQWRVSFEGQLSILRPHLTARVLDTISLSAWSAHGLKGEDPINAARDWSARMDAKPGERPRR